MERVALALVAMWIPALAAAGRPAPLVEAEAPGLAAVEPVVAVDAPAVVLAGGTVMTAVGDVFAPGFVVLKGGRIDAVGAGAPPQVAGARVVDVSGQFVTPGLIDTHSHLGVYPSPGANAHSDGNEATSPTTPGVWAEHSVWPQDPGLERAVAGGVTTIQVLPGSANLVGGRGVVLHMVPARGSRAMRFPGAPETLKMACGENPKRVYESRGPSTRMGNLRGQREAFLAAAEALRDWNEYAEKKAKWDEAQAASGSKKKKGGDAPKDAPKPPKRSLDTETLMGVLAGDILPQVHCYRADDMLSFLQLADEMGFSVRSFHHAVEAYKIADILAAHDVGVSTWADWWGFKLEAYDGVEANLGMVDAAGARAIVHSDSAIGIQRLNQEAAKGVRAARQAGITVSENDALRWLTMNPAWALGIDAEVGSLEAGKRADVVVWTASPFSVYAKARWVFVDGALRYDVDRPQTWSDFEIGWEVAP